MSEYHSTVEWLIAQDDFFISTDQFIQKNGWNVFIDFVKQLKTKYDPKIQTIKREYSICNCIIALASKTHLNHHERLALMMILLPLGKEEDLLAIMKKQDNFKESVTLYQIANYKAKGKFKGISKAKLREWGICKC